MAGHGLFADPGRRFPEASVQITDGHRLFAKAPLTKVTHPTTMLETGKAEYSVEVDQDANITYSSGGTELRCRYWINGSLTDYRRFFVTTAPVFEIKNATPLTPSLDHSRRVVTSRDGALSRVTDLDSRFQV